MPRSFLGWAYVLLVIVTSLSSVTSQGAEARVTILEQIQDEDGFPDFRLASLAHLSGNNHLHVVLDASDASEALVLMWDEKKRQPVSGWEPTLINLNPWEARLVPGEAGKRLVASPKSIRCYVLFFLPNDPGLNAVRATLDEISRTTNAGKKKALFAQLRGLVTREIAAKGAGKAEHRLPKELVLGGAVRGPDWNDLDWRENAKKVTFESGKPGAVFIPFK